MTAVRVVARGLSDLPRVPDRLEVATVEGWKPSGSARVLLRPRARLGPDRGDGPRRSHRRPEGAGAGDHRGGQLAHRGAPGVDRAARRLVQHRAREGARGESDMAPTARRRAARSSSHGHESLRGGHRASRVGLPDPRAVSRPLPPSTFISSGGRRKKSARSASAMTRAVSLPIPEFSSKLEKAHHDEARHEHHGGREQGAAHGAERDPHRVRRRTAELVPGPGGTC